MRTYTLAELVVWAVVGRRVDAEAAEILAGGVV
jgi:hypothetical protein